MAFFQIFKDSNYLQSYPDKQVCSVNLTDVNRSLSHEMLIVVSWLHHDIELSCQKHPKLKMIKIKQKRSRGDGLSSSLSSVIRNNTDNMKEIVAQLERTITERNSQIEELRQFNEILKLRNESVSSKDLGSELR